VAEGKEVKPLCIYCDKTLSETYYFMVVDGVKAAVCEWCLAYLQEHPELVESLAGKVRMHRKIGEA
jgi:hypothetical protein